MGIDDWLCLVKGRMCFVVGDYMTVISVENIPYFTHLMSYGFNYILHLNIRLSPFLDE